MKNKFTCAVSPGHTATHQGASRGRVSEYSLSARIMGDFTARCAEAGHTCHLIGSASNKDQIARINRLKPDFGLELHFNNMAPLYKHYNGCLCMHSGSTKGQVLARNVNNNIADLLHVKNRGIYKGHYRLDKRRKIIDMIRLTRCIFVVIEPLYFSNTSDFEKIDPWLISAAIFEGCLNYWEVI